MRRLFASLLVVALLAVPEVASAHIFKHRGHCGAGQSRRQRASRHTTKCAAAAGAAHCQGTTCNL